MGFIKTIEDLKQRDEYKLITDRLEVQDILSDLDVERENVSLFVKTENGTYESVLSFNGHIPVDHKPVEELVNE